MTDKEIIRALRICSRRTGYKGCGPCPLFDDKDCMGNVTAAAADLIERLTAENVVLPDGEASAIESLRKEIEWMDMVIALAQRKQAEAEAERDALREKQRWIPVTERLPEERALVNVVWVNRAPEPYYEKIKGVPFSDTACFYRGRWYWASPVVLDLLAEYGEDEPDSVDEAVEITHWMPLPEAPKFADVLRGAPEAPEEGEKA